MADDAEKPQQGEKGGREIFRLLATASTVGINLVISTFAGFAIGYYVLDRYLNTYPWFTIIFLLLGIAAGFKHLFKIASRADGGEDKKGSRGQGVK